MANVVETILKLQGSRAFQQAAQGAARAIGSVGTESEKSGEKAKIGWKGVAKWAGGTAAIYGAGRFLKGAVSQTEDLAKSTMTLQRATGMDAKTASSWAEITKVRGIGTKQFQVGLTKLSKTMEAARGGNEKALATLQKYGVNQDQIAKGDISGTIGNLADSFALMKNPAEKAALAQSLFGKSGQSLVPILSGGSKGIQEQLGMAQKYGAVIGDTSGAKDMIAKQREMQIAMDGLKIQLGTKLLPAIQSFVTILLKVVQVMSPLLRSSTALYIALGLLTVAYITLKVATIASTIATLSFNAAILLIPLAIAAVVAGVILMYTKWKWFHDAVNNTWAWIKSHWQLLATILLGPIAGAVILIVRNFDKIKAAVRSVWSTITSVFGKVKGFLSRVFSTDFVSGIGRGIADWLNAHTPFGDKIKVGPLKFTLPALAAGGTILRAGAALVGEQGPEIVSLPRGASVYPTPAIEPLSARPPLDGGPGRSQTVITKVYLDRRQIAQAVGSYASDQQARR